MGEMSPAMVRAARELLGWTGERLAREASLSVSTLNRFQYAANDAAIGVSVGNARKIRDALEAAGVEFTSNDDGVGVRVRSPHLRRSSSN
jgi:transcriptional regulator with XRE-family HTH domain